KPAEDGEQQKREREANHEQPRDVAAREVAELVREHRLDLGSREPVDQRVEEDDALVRAESREVRVPVARAPRSVHDEKTLRVESAALDELLDAPAQIALLERREAVDERSDPARE